MPRYNVTCENYEDIVNEVLDLRLAPQDDRDLAAHAQNCAACFEILADYTAVEDSIKLLKGDIDSILALAQPPVPPQRSRRKLIGWLTATAAAILICLSVLQFSQPNRATPHRVALNQSPTGNTEATRNAVWPSMPKLDLQQALATSAFRLEFPLPKISELTERFDSLQPVLKYSAEIPVVYPIGIPLDLLRKSLTRPTPTAKPDLGHHFDVTLTLAAV